MEGTPLGVVALAGVAPLVIEATSEGVAGPAMWNTPGGARPKSTPDETTQLFTPVKLDVSKALRGSLGSQVMVFPGGTNGCDTEVYSNQALELPKSDTTYILFLKNVTDTSGTKLDDFVELRGWPRQKDGTYRDDLGASYTLDDLSKLLAANPVEVP